MTPIPLTIEVVAAVSTLALGLGVGYLVGWAQGRAEPKRYKEGLADARAQHEGRGGPCWLRGQLPPNTED